MGSTRLFVSIEKQLSTFTLLMRLEVASEILVLFGPSGAGKTQTLNAIAGLIDPDAGEIALDGVPFFRNQPSVGRVNLPPRRRSVGYVFQHYALFPHLTAIENVAYSLWRNPAARKRAIEMLERMGLSEFGARYPHELSGGQQQRVAIARALAAEPKVLLMDEPFSALDRAIRDSLHIELRTIQAESNLTVVYVTHNLDDALAVGHRLALVDRGQVEQSGEPGFVLRHPSTARAMEILGTPNVFSARVLEATDARLLIDWQGLQLEAQPRPAEPGETVTGYIRPEVIQPKPRDPTRSEGNQIRARLVSVRVGRYNDALRVMLENCCEIEIARPMQDAATPASDGWTEFLLPRDGIVVL